ncbi:hypothetical protein CMI47_21460 [Candidatus Pacearchaeota archaeon]|jgi:ribosomal protein L32|nr:hypothetical protein [Candidatus Pacearchaeota archaeon]|tara:strand:- start:2272 stop:2634 length:363 start_codon:yes stop_codon:yes gene_type:complete
MDDRHIDTETAEKWQRLATLWREAHERLEMIRLELLTELHVTEGRALQEIGMALDATSGNAYMFTPQSEWTGGDSSQAENFKWRAPHVVKAPTLTRCNKCKQDTGINTTCPNCVVPTVPR